MPATEYPPPDHILRDLDIHAEVPSDTTARVRIPATPLVAGADGGVRAGVLAVIVDLAAGASALRSLGPDWMATADLTVQVVGPATGPWVEARAAVVRRGRTTLVVEAGIFDVPAAPDGDGRARAPSRSLDGGEGRQVGTASVTMAVLPARQGGTDGPAAVAAPHRWSFVGAGLRAPVHEAVGALPVEPATGRLALPVVPYLHNSFGAVQGGVMALLAELAGLAALDAVVPPDGDGCGAGGAAAVTDLEVAYLALGRVGPIISRAEVLSAGPRGGHAVVELADAGAGDRLTTRVNVRAAVPGTAGARG